MNCLVTEIKNNKAVLLDAKGNFFIVRNKNYQVGQTIEYHSANTLQQAAGIAACLLITVGIAAGGYKTYYTPVAILSIDINPSIQLEVNIFDRIINTSAFNTEGEIILNEANVANSKTIKSIEQIIDIAEEKGYFSELDNSVIIDVVDSKKHITDKIVMLKDEYTGRNIEVIVERASEEDAENSKNMNISIGRAKLLKEYSDTFGGSIVENQSALEKSSVKEVQEIIKKAAEKPQSTAAPSNTPIPPTQNNTAEKADWEHTVSVNHKPVQYKYNSSSQNEVENTVQNFVQSSGNNNSGTAFTGKYVTPVSSANIAEKAEQPSQTSARVNKSWSSDLYNQNAAAVQPANQNENNSNNGNHDIVSDTDKHSNDKTTDNKPNDTKPSDDKTADNKPNETIPYDDKTADNKTDETKPSDDKTADNKPDEIKPYDDKTTDNKPDEIKLSDDKTADNKPNETKPSDDKTADNKPNETKPSDNKPIDSRPSSDNAPSENNHASAPNNSAPSENNHASAPNNSAPSGNNHTSAPNNRAPSGNNHASAPNNSAPSGDNHTSAPNNSAPSGDNHASAPNNSAPSRERP
ncbi:MAG: hypothetical protein MR413_00645 [Clostridia bacterium]|nr:hypothetical protein [Clostridia bacterium]